MAAIVVFTGAALLLIVPTLGPGLLSAITRLVGLFRQL